MPIAVTEIEQGQILWLNVNSNRHEKERLWIFSGIAVLDTWHRSDDEDWGSDYALIPMTRLTVYLLFSFLV